MHVCIHAGTIQPQTLANPKNYPRFDSQISESYMYIKSERSDLKHQATNVFR